LYKDRLIVIIGIGLILAVVIAGILFTTITIQQTTQKFLSPVDEANRQLKTQVSQLLNPTPTIIADPITVIHEIRSLARLETIQYSVEKVITAETGQGQFGFLFGDKLLFVAHGNVIAGIDMQKINSEDLALKGNVLYVQLPEPEVFISTLDNEKSYIYDREMGILTHGDSTLETQARQVAEDEILKSAIDDGILIQAKQNGESYLSKLFLGLGYQDVIFTYSK
jgi:hypothetical protein